MQNAANNNFNFMINFTCFYAKIDGGKQQRKLILIELRIGKINCMKKDMEFSMF